MLEHSRRRIVGTWRAGGPLCAGCAIATVVVLVAGVFWNLKVRESKGVPARANLLDPSFSDREFERALADWELDLGESDRDALSVAMLSQAFPARRRRVFAYLLLRDRLKPGMSVAEVSRQPGMSILLDEKSLYARGISGPGWGPVADDESVVGIAPLIDGRRLTVAVLRLRGHWNFYEITRAVLNSPGHSEISVESVTRATDYSLAYPGFY